MTLKTTLKNLWNDESAQGATEYILLLVIVVALALTFKEKIMAMVKGKLGEIEGGMAGLKPSGE
jgi:Flp pilus assembly pilin Flp